MLDGRFAGAPAAAAADVAYALLLWFRCQFCDCDAKLYDPKKLVLKFFAAGVELLLSAVNKRWINRLCVICWEDSALRTYHCEQ
jgi:hypothetical protein